MSREKGIQHKGGVEYNVNIIERSTGMDIQAPSLIGMQIHEERIWIVHLLH
jgi:hypothetical protein